jgi:hypothetical protein
LKSAHSALTCLHASAESKNFQKFIRAYNNSVSFTSLGFTSSDIAKTIPGAPVFTIQGALSHNIGSIEPQVTSAPHFAQIFVVGKGGLPEATYRKQAALGPRPSAMARAKVDPKIILKLQTFMYNHNPYAKLYRHAGDILKQHKPISMILRTVENDSLDLRRYNCPSTDDIGIIIEGEGVPKAPRQIVLHQRSGNLSTISDLHSAYLPLRYPVFFPFGAQQWEPTFKTEIKPGHFMFLL